MHERLVLRVGSGVFECRWSVSHKSTGYLQHPYWQSVDVTVQKIPSLTNGDSKCETETPAEPLLDPSAGAKNVADFMSTLLSFAACAPAGRGRAAKLIVPRVRGYIVRSDIVPLRMVDCLHVICTKSFAEPQQWFSGEDLTEHDMSDLRDVFSTAAGGMILDTGDSMSDMVSSLDALEANVRDRLSFPWVMKERRPKQTLALVGNTLQYLGHGNTGANHYSGAKALDINLVVIDDPGCWLKDPQYGDLREAFLPIDMKRNEDLPDRIVDAISRYEGKIDGIVTFRECYSVFVARAAALLSLPTESPEAVDLSTNKYKTSVAEGRQAYHATNVDDALKVINKSGIQYPLILKPCQGGSSEGVSRANDASEIVRAVQKIESLSERHGTLFVIEEYCDGPEVDVNMVLCDGQLLFLEICDDLPKSGDDMFVGNVASFLETGMILPSKLPSFELNMLGKSMHQSMLRAGFQSGVFHLEARVKDSEMVYALQNGIMDLEYDRNPSKIAIPSPWLIEINPRPVGKIGSDAVEMTYGIEYVGLHLLFALNEKERVKALSHPFIQGAQYCCQIIFVPTEKGGVFDSDDICKELQQRRPDLAHHISTSACFYKRGEVVPSPSSGITSFIASLHVFSRVGRAHVQEISESIKKEIRYSIK